ncbi:MAG: saccharopine dehydrogenase NADP-binding domain-containing protein [Thermoleophilaceae bacterium]|nr:saccharopine dehydrogenase NADP-binding domain-containing protein [Thermoleophilaceae bacterium]
MVGTGERLYDIVLVGATGFTGGLTAEYLARHAPPECRWALAGRNREKLERLRARLAEVEPSRGEVPLLHADVNDAGSLRELAECTRVVTTTVGPYINYGEPLVAACAAAGTDYTDLTGEPEFVDLMYVNHHRQAAETGARMVHACGFDSVPHDLGALFTVELLPEGVPIDLRGFVSAGGRLSAGTVHSAITGFSRARGAGRVAAERKRLEQRPADRTVRGHRPLPYRESELGAWALPLPTIDPQIVLRSARALERYGPEFTYGHFAAVKQLPIAVAAVGGVAGLLALAQLPPARDWLLGRMKPGEGPSAEQREKGWFKVRFHGVGGGRRVATEVAGADPGYGETSKMLAECALCLAHDDLPETAGQVTTAVAMGHPLIGRLERAGISFKVLEASSGAQTT